MDLKKAMLILLFTALTTYVEADIIRITGSESVQSYLSSKIDQIEKMTGHRIEMEVTGSTDGYKAANSGRLGMASRPPNPSEQSRNLQIYEIGVEALVLGVNFSNKTTSLNTEQIVGLFSGEIKNWNEINPSFNSAVSLYGPETKHGTFDFFANAFRIHPETLENQANLSSSHRKTMRYISIKEGSIGFFTLGSWLQQQLSYSSYVNLIAVNGVFPTHESATSGDYPLVQPLYFAKNSPLSRAEKAVVDYLATLQ